jgi:GTPase SAR1 family protein
MDTYRSCLLHRFIKNEWRTLSSQTIGVEFASKIIRVGTGTRRKRIKLQVPSSSSIYALQNIDGGAALGHSWN